MRLKKETVAIFLPPALASSLDPVVEKNGLRNIGEALFRALNHDLESHGHEAFDYSDCVISDFGQRLNNDGAVMHQVYLHFYGDAATLLPGFSFRNGGIKNWVERALEAYAAFTGQGDDAHARNVSAAGLQAGSLDI